MLSFRERAFGFRQAVCGEQHFCLQRPVQRFVSKPRLSRVQKFQRFVDLPQRNVSLSQPERDGIARSAQLARVDELGGCIRVVAEQKRNVASTAAAARA